jgi:hypothetical protein
MPVVRVKGVANPMQFPDDMDIEDIREFLRKRFASQAVAGNQPMDLAPLQGQAKASEQSLAQKAGQGISNALVDSGIVSDRFGAQQIGQSVTSIGEFLPGIGDAAAGDEFGRALKQGDNFGMAMGALGAIPLVGDAAKKGIKAYHGTPNKFDKFDLDKIGSTSDSGMFGKGFYFTEDQALAETYAKKDGRVIEAELNLKNPYIINSQDDIPNIDVPRNTKEDLKNADKNYSRLFTEKLQSQGYDGVIDNMTSGGKQFVVFDPKNIRSLNPSTDKAMSVGGDAAKSFKTTNGDVVDDLESFDFDMPLTHESSDENFTGEITSKSKQGAFALFDGVFSLHGDTGAALGKGGFEVTYYPRKGKVARMGDLDLDYDQAMETIKKEYPSANEDDLDSIYNLSADDDNIYDYDTNPLEEFGYDDLAEASWELQNLRGKIAVSQGYDAIEMSDENGISVMIPYGSKAITTNKVNK